MIPVRRCLLSVHDKTGLVDLAKGLAAEGAEIVSTGGTARALSEAGIPVTTVSSVTGFPELFGGRVKTLHPMIHGGILLRRDNPSDQEDARRAGVSPMDLVVVNLYPFEATTSRSGVSRDEAIEQIDIGGPAMVRAAAKNHAHVAVVVDPADYPLVLDELRDLGGISAETSVRLAAKAFSRVSQYDATISAWLDGDMHFESAFTLRAVRQATLRHGENPHQAAAAFVVPGEDEGILTARLHQGKQLSYNNIVDLDAAWALAGDLPSQACAIIKHANPCGAALGSTLLEALVRARACDPVSAFGGVFGFNSPVDDATARSVLEGFVECVVAPEYSVGALAVFAEKPNVRVLEARPPSGHRPGRDWKRITGGLLVQAWDEGSVSRAGWRVVSRRQPEEREWQSMEFGWRLVRHVKSNAIVFCGSDRVLGIGAGQMSRVDSVELAVRKASRSGLSLADSSVASDAFFPFRDGIDALHAAGASAVVQPGGSRRDDEVIQAADDHGLALVFTGSRHFKH